MITINKDQLEALVRRPLADYDSDKFPIQNGDLQPRELLNRILARGIREELQGLKPVSEGPYKTGEIWYGAYNMIYFYLGRISEGKDILVCLGGDGSDPGTIHLGSIDNEKYGLYRKIFPSQD